MGRTPRKYWRLISKTVFKRDQILRTFDNVAEALSLASQNLCESVNMSYDCHLIGMLEREDVSIPRSSLLKTGRSVVAVPRMQYLMMGRLGDRGRRARRSTYPAIDLGYCKLRAECGSV